MPPPTAINLCPAPRAVGLQLLLWVLALLLLLAGSAARAAWPAAAGSTAPGAMATALPGAGTAVIDTAALLEAGSHGATETATEADGAPPPRQPRTLTAGARDSAWPGPRLDAGRSPPCLPGPLRPPCAGPIAR